MAITRTPIIDDSGSGQDGTVIDNAWKQEFYDQIDAYVGQPAGPWIDIPFNQFFFGASQPVWIVEAADQVTFAYAMLGPKTMAIQLYLVGTSLSTNWADSLNVVVPNGQTLNTRYQGGSVAYKNAGTAGTGTIFSAAGTVLNIYRDLTPTAWNVGSVDLLLSVIVSLA
jgi:hypothetical protein